MSPTRTLHEPLTLANLGSVDWETLEPCEQPTPPALRKRADCFDQRFIKYPHCGCFHSPAEFVHAILLEIELGVQRFVPQPYRLRVSGRQGYYIPDCFVHRKDRTDIIELKPGGEFDPFLQQRLEAFFRFHNMRFSVLANETVMTREVEARNWLPILQVLANAQVYGHDTDSLEQRLWQGALERPVGCVADFIVPGSVEGPSLTALAFYRLLHRHLLEVDLSTAPLRYDTEVRPCTSPGVSV